MALIMTACRCDVSRNYAAYLLSIDVDLYTYTRHTFIHTRIPWR